MSDCSCPWTDILVPDMHRVIVALLDPLSLLALQCVSKEVAVLARQAAVALDKFEMIAIQSYSTRWKAFVGYGNAKQLGCYRSEYAQFFCGHAEITGKQAFLEAVARANVEGMQWITQRFRLELTQAMMLKAIDAQRREPVAWLVARQCPWPPMGTDLFESYLVCKDDVEFFTYISSVIPVEYDLTEMLRQCCQRQAYAILWHVCSECLRPEESRAQQIEDLAQGILGHWPEVINTYRIPQPTPIPLMALAVRILFQRQEQDPNQ